MNKINCTQVFHLYTSVPRNSTSQYPGLKSFVTYGGFSLILAHIATGKIIQPLRQRQQKIYPIALPQTFIIFDAPNQNIMEFPAGLKYTKDHEWIKVDGDSALVGITEFAQRELGDIVYIDINSVGKEVAKDEVFGTVEAVKTVSDLFMPVTGTITEINAALDKSPELVNSDPYGDGWMVKLTIADASQVDGLLSADDYKSLVGA